jgi:valyl-tRNA synthetase
MSKSLGNSPDPLDLIAKYGADGLRFGLMRIAPTGQDIRFDERQIEEGRNFATKLWNAARFRQMHGASEATPKIDIRSLSIYAVEVLARLNETIDAIDSAYHDYHFNLVAQHLYDFVWSDYCDWFVEAAKTEIFSEDESKKKSALAVMDYVLSAIARLLHPFMPHITEELWSLLGLGKESIQFAPLPKKLALKDVDLKKRKLVAAIYETVARTRNIRAESGIPATETIRVRIDSDDAMLKREVSVIARLTNAEEVIIAKSIEYSGYSGYSAAGMIVVERAHIDKAAERERLDKRIADVEAQLRATEAKLANKSFVDRAPKEVVEEHRQRKENFAEQLKKLKEARDKLR